MTSWLRPISSYAVCSITTTVPTQNALSLIQPSLWLYHIDNAVRFLSRHWSTFWPWQIVWVMAVSAATHSLSSNFHCAYTTMMTRCGSQRTLISITSDSVFSFILFLSLCLMLCLFVWFTAQIMEMEWRRWWKEKCFWKRWKVRRLSGQSMMGRGDIECPSNTADGMKWKWTIFENERAGREPALAPRLKARDYIPIHILYDPNDRWNIFSIDSWRRTNHQWHYAILSLCVCSSIFGALCRCVCCLFVFVRWARFWCILWSEQTECCTKRGRSHIDSRRVNGFYL